MSRKQTEPGSLGAQFDDEMIQKLRSKKTELRKEEEQRVENERKQRIKEKKEREANKSFEELLNESDLNWKAYKK
ncbi:YqkE family protein [Halobacillus seohaensis]|uniref:YqkE family protein n=1 Tax=Halobacillus seohaensis TaxID=447421 RepID=A0ABW2EI85_9BACI